MEKVFQEVQREFMHLSLILGKVNFDKVYLSETSLVQIADALTDAYVLLNQGFCENATMCEECVHNREQLFLLMQMIDICESNKKVDEKTFAILENFSLSIPIVLNKMESLYLENLELKTEQ